MLASSIRYWVFSHPGMVKAFKMAGVLAAVAVVAYLGWTMWPHTSPASAATSAERKVISSGRYDDALRDIDGHLSRDPGNKEWTGLKDRLLKKLTVRLKLHYLRGNKLPLQKAERGKLTLSPSDTYYYVVEPSESCNLYVFQIHSSGELTQIFPNKANSSTRNPVPAGKQQVPSGPQGLRLKGRSGEERVIAVAARWELPELEQLAKAVSVQRDPAKRQAALARFQARMDNEKRYSPQLGGLVFGEASFQNSGDATGQ
jgi:hypothetical protein